VVVMGLTAQSRLLDKEPKAGFKLQREPYTLELFLHDYRLTTSDGKDVDWKTAKGKWCS
jgi:hypothetical protein